MRTIETDHGEVEVVTYCDIIDKCENCPRMGDDCDGKDEEEYPCSTCYYEAFDEKAYPCSRCVYNRPTEVKWQPKKGGRNVHRR